MDGRIKKNVKCGEREGKEGVPPIDPPLVLFFVTLRNKIWEFLPHAIYDPYIAFLSLTITDTLQLKIKKNQFV